VAVGATVGGHVRMCVRPVQGVRVFQRRPSSVLGENADKRGPLEPLLWRVRGLSQDDDQRPGLARADRATSAAWHL